MTRGLAIGGTALLLVLPLLTAASGLAGVVPAGTRWFELLAVAAADLFPFSLLGACLVVWASLRAHSHRAVIIGSLAVSLCSAVIATVRISGQSTPTPAEMSILLGSIVGYWAGLMIACLGATSLVRSLGGGHG